MQLRSGMDQRFSSRQQEPSRKWPDSDGACVCWLRYKGSSTRRMTKRSLQRARKFADVQSPNKLSVVLRARIALSARHRSGISGNGSWVEAFRSTRWNPMVTRGSVLGSGHFSDRKSVLTPYSLPIQGCMELARCPIGGRTQRGTYPLLTCSRERGWPTCPSCRTGS